MSELGQFICMNCGGDVHAVDEHTLKCNYCGSAFDHYALQQKTVSLREFLDQANLEYIKNQRHNLYKAVCEKKYISKTEVRHYATEIKQYLPDDFQANFYLEALSGDKKRINELLREIDVEENYELLPPIFRFLITSLENGFLLELNQLAERAYKRRDLALYSQTMTEISEEAEKVSGGVYETILPRDVFIAYSSKDMTAVSKLCEALEEEGFSCFVAARNLRHGVGSVENYDTALREAMDNCTCFLFVSSVNSRKFECDAIRKEIPYIKSGDIRNAPPEYRFNYKTMPTKYKKPRIEYCIGTFVRDKADMITNGFFDGYEWVYDIEGVKERLVRILTATAEDIIAEETAFAVPATQHTPSARAPRNSGCNHKPVKIPGNPATCTEDGSTEGELCPLCGEMLRKVEVIPAKGHHFGDWHIKKPAGCTEDGERECVCADCGVRETERIPSRGGHILGPWTILREPAPGVEGLKVKKCVVCGAQVEEETIPAPAATPPKPLQIPEYTANADGKTCTVIGRGTCTEEAIVLPMEIDGLRVTGIGNGAFRGCRGLAGVEIPDSVTSICESAFCDCAELVRVSVPNSVTEIGDWAFKGCASLAALDVPTSVKRIGYGAFYGCASLTAMDVPDSVTDIGRSAFYDCARLASVRIPSSVTGIESKTFYGCTSLVRADIPDSVTSIGRSAFCGCRSLASAEIPASVTSIGSLAFNDCASLAAAVIPDSVKSIGDRAFCGCTSLAVAVLPESITSIGERTFFGCTSLTDVVIPDSVLSIGESAFEGCASLVSAVIPDSVKIVCHRAFRDCTKLASAVISDSVTSLGYRIFENCASLAAVQYTGSQEDWERIEKNYDWAGGSSVWIQYNAKKPKKAASEGLAYKVNDDGNSCTVTGQGTCEDVDIVIPEEIDGYRVTVIGKSAFRNAFERVFVPRSVTTIDVNAFGGYGKIEVSLKNPNYLSVDGNLYSKDCKTLLCYQATSEASSFRIPDFVTGIGVGAFAGCKSLASVEIPGSVTSIGLCAFAGCESLASVVIPDSVTSMGDAVFMGCHSLASVELFASVKIIGHDFFAGCISLTSVEIPGSVTSIGLCAFAGCESLASVVIPDSVTSMGDAVFMECHSLTSVELSGSVTSIGEHAFNCCESLARVVIPNSVKSIGEYAFFQCGNLASVEIPSSVTSIGSAAFHGCRSLASVEIPASVTSIGSGAFIGCSSLTSVVIPDSVTSIGEEAFVDCMSLTSLVIPDSVTSIGAKAFKKCTSLKAIRYEGTKKQWEQIKLDKNWKEGASVRSVECTGPIFNRFIRLK